MKSFQIIFCVLCAFASLTANAQQKEQKLAAMGQPKECKVSPGSYGINLLRYEAPAEQLTPEKMAEIAKGNIPAEMLENASAGLFVSVRPQEEGKICSMEKFLTHTKVPNPPENLDEIIESDGEIGSGMEVLLSEKEQGGMLLDVEYLTREFEGFIEYGPGPAKDGSFIVPIFKTNIVKSRLEMEDGKPALLSARTLKIPTSTLQNEKAPELVELIFITAKSSK